MSAGCTCTQSQRREIPACKSLHALCMNCGHWIFEPPRPDDPHGPEAERNRLVESIMACGNSRLPNKPE